MPAWRWFSGVMIATALLGWVAAQPPAPLPRSASAEQFSAVRAMDHVRAVAAAPHVTGSAGNAAVVRYLEQRLQSLGFTVRRAEFPLPAGVAARLEAQGGASVSRGVNLVAVRSGRDTTRPAVALMAHHDAVPGSPGAADDAFGLAAVLEIARAIPPSDQLHDLVVLFTDAEEFGLAGANALFAPTPAGDPIADRIAVVLNFDARGGGGRTIMFETSRRNGELVALYRDAVRQPHANSLAVSVYERLPNGTDLTPALARGIAGYNFAPLGRSRLYHSPHAAADSVEVGTLQHMGSQGLDLTRVLVAGLTPPHAAPDLVFSDLLGVTTIAYPPLFGWVLLASCAVLLLVAMRRHRGAWRGADLGWSVLAAGVALVMAGAVLTGLNWLSIGPGGAQYYDRLAALPRLELQALLAIGAVVGALMLVWHARSASSRTFGAAWLTWMTAAAVQAGLPAAGPFFAWPLLALSLVLVSSSPAWRVPSRWAAALIAVVGLSWLGGVAHFALLAIGGPAPAAIVPLLLPGMALLAPLMPPVQRRSVLASVSLLLAAAVGVALWVRLDPPADSRPGYVDARTAR